MLLGILGASLLGNMLTGKGVIRAGYGSKGPSIKDLRIFNLKKEKE